MQPAATTVQPAEPAGLPDLTGFPAEMLEQAMVWVHGHVRRALPDAAWIRQRFLRRTIREVLADGFTLAYAPCVDRTLLTTALLGRMGLTPYVVLHDSPNGTWHLVIELPLGGEEWAWADFGTRESRLYPGRYRYGRVPGNVPRLLRMRAPRSGPKIWDSRPPLRFLAGMGVNLLGRFDRFDSELEGYRTEVEGETYSLGDRIVRDPADSVFAEIWAAREVVAIGDPGVDCVDLSPVHLYLERVP